MSTTKETQSRARAQTAALLRIRTARLVTMVLVWVAFGVFGRVPKAAVLAPLLILAYVVINLPFDVAGYAVLRRNGLMRCSFARASLDILKRRVLEASAVAVMLGVATLGPRGPEAWLWWWVAVIGVATIYVAAFPFLARLFARSRPLDEPLRSKVAELCQRADLPAQKFEIREVAHKTSIVQAAVLGLGPTRRVVITDTLLEICAPDEICALVAHELGHARAHHVAIRLLMLALGELAALWVASFAIPPGSEPWFSPLIFLTAVLLGMLTLGSLSRRQEFEADRYSFELTGDPGAFIRAMEKAEARNLVLVDEKNARRFNHPATAARIAAAREFLAKQSPVASTN